MKTFENLITVVSWEDRFIKGFEKNLKKHKINSVMFFEFEGYQGRNKKNFEKAKLICENSNIPFQEKNLDFLTPKENWLTVRQTIHNYCSERQTLLDITTMPREIIWITLFFLQQVKSTVEYIYYRPKKYNQEWLSRDPSEPRLIYKMSGISYLTKLTLLIIFVGHDYQRVISLINSFEPKKLILISDKDLKGKEVANNCVNDFSGSMIIERFDLDSYNQVNSFELIAKKVKDNLDEYNIIFSSLGPKTSAIPIYQVNRLYPQTALCYLPCKEFNENYSKGIIENELIEGKIEVVQSKFGVEDTNLVSHSF
jgi:hypothetical protein